MIVESAVRGESTAEHIVRAAYALFMEQGYHGTSMRQIAQNAGLALGGLYNHFTSKEEIFRAVFTAYHPAHEVLPALLQADTQSAAVWVRDATGRITTALNQRSNFLNLVFIDTVEFRGRHTAEVVASVLPVIGSFRDSLPWRDELRPIPVPILMRAFIGLITSHYITERVLGELASSPLMENSLDYFMDIYLHGILKREEHEHL